MSNTNKPVAKIRLYPVTAAIWRNENEKGIFYGFTIERAQGREGQLQVHVHLQCERCTSPRESHRSR